MLTLPCGCLRSTSGHLRLEAHPLRTDMAPGETGTLRVEGTMGGADTHDSLAKVPVDLHGTWQDAQLGGLTSLLLGRDAGLRGDLSLDIGLLGTVGRNAITAGLALNNARRADFYHPRSRSPSRPAGRAVAENSFHTFSRRLRCHLPPADDLRSRHPRPSLRLQCPDVRRPQTASLNLTLPSLPAQTFFGWLSVATPHPPAGFTGDGTLGGASLGRGECAAGGGGFVRDSTQRTLQRAASAERLLASDLVRQELTLSGESLAPPSLGPGAACARRRGSALHSGRPASNALAPRGAGKRALARGHTARQRLRPAAGLAAASAANSPPSSPATSTPPATLSTSAARPSRSACSLWETPSRSSATD